jgi:hypothetical protein
MQNIHKYVEKKNLLGSIDMSQRKTLLFEYLN